MITREDQELWIKYVATFNNFDPDWYYDNNTKEHQETNKEREGGIARAAQDLKVKGWDVEKYYRVKIKSMRLETLDKEEVSLLVDNPATGHDKGWRNE